MENQPPSPNDFWSKSRWLARFSFTFLIIAVFLAYTGYQGFKNHDLSRGRIILYFIAATLAFVMFLAGTREKHRPR